MRGREVIYTKSQAARGGERKVKPELHQADYLHGSSIWGRRSRPFANSQDLTGLDKNVTALSRGLPSLAGLSPLPRAHDCLSVSFLRSRLTHHLLREAWHCSELLSLFFFILLGTVCGYVIIWWFYVSPGSLQFTRAEMVSSPQSSVFGA